jgi:hypothetical protein
MVRIFETSPVIICEIYYTMSKISGLSVLRKHSGTPLFIAGDRVLTEEPRLFVRNILKA